MSLICSAAWPVTGHAVEIMMAGRKAGAVSKVSSDRRAVRRRKRNVIVIQFETGDEIFPLDIVAEKRADAGAGRTARTEHRPFRDLLILLDGGVAENEADVRTCGLNLNLNHDYLRTGPRESDRQMSDRRCRACSRGRG